MDKMSEDLWVGFEGYEALSISFAIVYFRHGDDIREGEEVE